MSKKTDIQLENGYLTAKPQKISPAKMFLLLLLSFEGIAFLMIVVTGGNAFGDLLFFDRLDIMMDFFNPVMGYKTISPSNLYTDAVVFYPPLAMLLFYLAYALIPKQMIMAETPREARMEQSAMILALAIVVLLTVLIVFVLMDLRKGSSTEKKLCAFAAIFSYPMIFQLDRGNIILLAFFFTLLFIFWMDSEKRWKREVAFIALALAFGIKGYPALFGLILLAQKRWKDAIRCAIYGIAAFVIPALFFRGIDLFEILRALGGMSDHAVKQGFGYKVNFSNTIHFWASLMDVDSFLPPIIDTLCLVLGIVCLLAAFVPGKLWKKVCLIAIFIAGVPGFSYVYVMIFFLLPAFVFMNETDGQEKHQRIDYFYAVLLVFCLAPLPFTGIGYITRLHYPMTVTVAAEGLALFGLAFALIGDRAAVVYRMIKNHRSARTVTSSDTSTMEETTTNDQ